MLSLYDMPTSDVPMILPEPVDATDYRSGMARLGAAVNVVTTDGPGGRAGFTASAVCSVTDSPPTLLVCVNRSSSAYDALKANETVCVNTLAPQQEPLSRIFGGKTPMPERFSIGRWRNGRLGAPVLEEALVAFDCRIRSVTSVGTHDVVFCEVVDVHLGSERQALLYCSRTYHSIAL